MRTSTPVGRRTVTRTAAWAVPAVATAAAAPAHAATSGHCPDWGVDTLSGTTGRVPFLAFTPSGLQADLVYAAVRNGKPAVRDSATGRASATWEWLRLNQAAGMSQGDSVTLTIDNFVTPQAYVSVRNLQLTVTAIDKVTGQWADQISFDPPPDLVVSQGANLTRGQDGSFSADREGAASGSDGDVTVRWNGPLRTVRVTYTAADSQNASPTGQFVGVGRFSYDNCL
jgi:hypothetical protein